MGKQCFVFINYYRSYDAFDVSDNYRRLFGITAYSCFYNQAKGVLKKYSDISKIPFLLFLKNVSFGFIMGYPNNNLIH